MELDYIKRKIHWWPDDVLQAHLDDIKKLEDNSIDPNVSLMFCHAEEYGIDIVELRRLVITEEERRKLYGLIY